MGTILIADDEDDVDSDDDFIKVSEKGIVRFRDLLFSIILLLSRQVAQRSVQSSNALVCEHFTVAQAAASLNVCCGGATYDNLSPL